MIACLRVPAFAATLERAGEPALADRPLLLTRGRRLYACSEEAHARGVRPGMTVGAARARCPEARVRPANPERDAGVLDALLALLADEGTPAEPEPQMQEAICYLDLGRLPPDHALERAREIGRAVRGASRLAPSLGLAGGKFPARVVARAAGANRARLVPPGREAAMLAPLPVSALPIDEEMATRLSRLGIRTIGAFAALPRRAVVTQWGREGQRLHRLACGEDPSPVHPRLPAPSITLLDRFEPPIAARDMLAAAIARLAGRLGARLGAGRRAARTLWLRVTLEDGTRRERRRRLREPARGEAALTRALEGLLDQLWIHCGVVTLETIATALAPTGDGAQQLTLLPDEKGARERLDAALPTLVARHAPATFLTPHLTDPDAPLLEARFALEPLG